MLKKCCAVFLSIIMLFSFAACGKSKEVKAVEEAIKSIGDVTIEKELLIQEARTLYDNLTEDKDDVENLETLELAEKHLDTLKTIQQICDALQTDADSVQTIVSQFDDDKEYIEQSMYNIADKLFKEEDYYTSGSLWLILDQYNDSKERLQEANYLWAKEMSNLGDYEAAIELLKDNTFEDSQNLYIACVLDLGKKYYAEKDFSKALEILEPILDNADAKVLVDQINDEIKQQESAKLKNAASEIAKCIMKATDYIESGITRYNLGKYATCISNIAFASGQINEAASKASSYSQFSTACSYLNSAHSTINVFSGSVSANEQNAYTAMRAAGNSADYLAKALREIQPYLK